MEPGPDTPVVSIFESFGDVDAAAVPETFARLLEEMAAVPAVAELKARSYDVLALERGDRVLDVGCGEGTDVERLAELVGPTGEAIGVDSSERLIAAAREKRRGRFVTGRATELPFPDDAFDACRADRVLQHLAEPQRAVGEMARVVRPGGNVAVSEMWFSITGDEPLERGRQLLFTTLFGTDGQPSWIGQYLPLLLTRAGLGEVRAEAAERVVGDPDHAARCLAFDATVSATAARDRPLLYRWRDEFDAALRAGRRSLVLHWTAAVGAA